MNLDCKGRMMYKNKTTIKNLQKEAGVCSHSNMHGDTKFKVNFEVKQDLYTHKAIKDENVGTVRDLTTVYCSSIGTLANSELLGTFFKSGSTWSGNICT
jgi:hypothetical protein